MNAVNKKAQRERAAQEISKQEIRKGETAFNDLIRRAREKGALIGE